MARLPVPGSDKNVWGDVLNDFLRVDHNDNGTLKATGSLATKYTKPASGIPEADLTTNLQTKLNFVINVKDYGALGDGTTNDTAAFTSAITAATSSTMSGTTKVVYIPAGTYIIEPITLPNRVGLWGAGPGITRLWRRNGGTTTGALIKNTTNARMCSVRQLMIDGKNVGDLTSHGLHMDNSAALDTDITNGISEYVDGRHFISDLVIQNCQGDGLHLQGRGDVMVTRVQSWINRGHGFVTGTDSFFSDCDSGAAGLDGFFIEGANTRLTSCKAWYAGDVSTSGAGVSGGTGHGFHIKDGNYATCILIGCEAQDNKRSGFYMNNVGRHVIQGCMADSNNRANLSHAGFEIINSFNNSVTGISWDRGANTFHQLAGLRIQGGTGNRVEITVSNIQNMAEAYITNDSTITSNIVQLAAQNGYRTVAYAASLTPDPYLGQHHVITLTGNIFIVSPTYKHTGMKLTMAFTQDATGGRTASWDSGFTVTNGIVNPAATATTVFDFVYNGSKWVQASNSYTPLTSSLVGRPAVGEYLTPTMTGTSTVQVTTLNEAYYIPIDIAVPTQIDALACNVTTAGTGAGIAVRLGLYVDSGTNRPTGSPLIDAGTVDPSTTGTKTATFTAITLQPGRYWVAGVVQGAITSGPSFTSASMLNQIGLSSLANFSHRTWSQGSVSGALGAVGTLTRVGTNPLLAVRISA